MICWNREGERTVIGYGKHGGALFEINMLNTWDRSSLYSRIHEEQGPIEPLQQAMARGRKILNEFLEAYAEQLRWSFPSDTKSVLSQATRKAVLQALKEKEQALRAAPSFRRQDGAGAFLRRQVELNLGAQKEISKL